MRRLAAAVAALIALAAPAAAKQLFAYPALSSGLLTGNEILWTEQPVSPGWQDYTVTLNGLMSFFTANAPPWPLAQGGTGAATAAGALANLGGQPALNVYTPQKFNAAAGSGSDDTAAINAAIAAAASNAAGGGVVWFPTPSSGFYNVCASASIGAATNDGSTTASIILPSASQTGVKLQGPASGGNAAIRVLPSCASPPDIMIVDPWMTTPIDTNPSTGIRTQSLQRFTIDSLRIDGWGLAKHNVWIKRDVGAAILNSVLRNVRHDGSNLLLGKDGATPGETYVDRSTRIENVNDSGHVIYNTIFDLPAYDIESYGTDSLFMGISVGAQIAYNATFVAGQNKWIGTGAWGYGYYASSASNDGQTDSRALFAELFTGFQHVADNTPGQGVVAGIRMQGSAGTTNAARASIVSGGTGGTPGVVQFHDTSGLGSTPAVFMGRVNAAGQLAGSIVVTQYGAYASAPGTVTVTNDACARCTGALGAGATVAVTLGASGSGSTQGSVVTGGVFSAAAYNDNANYGVSLAPEIASGAVIGVQAGNIASAGCIVVDNAGNLPSQFFASANPGCGVTYNGSLGIQFKAVSSSYTQLPSDGALVFQGLSGTATLTLSSALPQGALLWVKNTTAYAIAGTGSFIVQLDGTYANYNILPANAPGSWALLQYDGYRWDIIQSSAPKQRVFTVCASGCTYTSPYTYAPTPGMVTVKWILGGAGAGGGGGAKQVANSAASGGAGGGGGGCRAGTFTAAQIGASQIVTTGSGGAAGLAATTNTTPGGVGGLGTATTLGSLLSSKKSGGGAGGQVAGNAGGGGGGGGFVDATSGSLGSGGQTGSAGATNAYATSGAPWIGFPCAGGDGSGSTSGNTASGSGSPTQFGPGGGGSGGALTTTNTGFNGGNGGFVTAAIGGSGGSGGAGGSGASAPLSTTDLETLFGGGGGGGASSAVTGYAGGDGGFPGGGGGGGGSADNGGTAGAGGKGGDGLAIGIENF